MTQLRLMDMKVTQGHPSNLDLIMEVEASISDILYIH